jgi:hypothetical protein
MAAPILIALLCILALAGCGERRVSCCYSSSRRSARRPPSARGCCGVATRPRTSGRHEMRSPAKPRAAEGWSIFGTTYTAA